MSRSGALCVLVLLMLAPTLRAAEGDLERQYEDLLAERKRLLTANAAGEAGRVHDPLGAVPAGRRESFHQRNMATPVEGGNLMHDGMRRATVPAAGDVRPMPVVPHR